MKNTILFLSAPLKERIWGGKYFKEVLKITESDENIGEMWSCSGYEGSDSIILNGEFKGKTLNEVYKLRPALFNNPSSTTFPILIKLISTSDKLSVQVHPDDDYAQKYENDLGKTEGWLILDSNEQSDIVIGHNAKDKKELENFINNDNFDGLLRKVSPKKGEFYPIPSGTIHALGKDLLLLEVQQSSNVTYRFYDYHRKDKNGNERELHIAKAVDVTSFEPYNQKIVNVFEDNATNIWKNKYFNVNLIEINKNKVIESVENYMICTVIDGEINVQDKFLHLGDSFIVCKNCENLTISGNGKIVTTETRSN